MAERQHRLFGWLLNGVFICLLLLAGGYFLLPVHAQNNPIRPFHVSGQYIPNSLTAPTPVEGGGALTASITVDLLVISNVDSATHTILIEDGQGTPFVLFPTLTVPATGSSNSTWIIPMFGTRFQNGIKWQADASNKLMGAIVGHR